jgi:hypothetical protein
MKRLVAACTVVLALVVVPRPATGQDNPGTPVTDLRTGSASPVASPVASPASSLETYTIQGAISLQGADYFITSEDGSCAGTRGFEDHTVGTPVTVRDGAGTVIATGQIGQSKPFPDDQECMFFFSVLNVPYSEVYVIQISFRGPLTYTFDELELTNWYLRLTIRGVA